MDDPKAELLKQHRQQQQQQKQQQHPEECTIDLGDVLPPELPSLLSRIWATLNFQRRKAYMPDGKGGYRPRWCPEEDAGFWSKIFYWYMGPLLDVGLKKPLEQEDLWDVAPQDDADLLWKQFQQHLLATRDPVTAPHGSVLRALWRAHWLPFTVAGVLRAVHDALDFLSPYLLEKLLQHMKDPDSRLESFKYAGLMTLASILASLIENYHHYILVRITLHCKVGLEQMIYDKGLRLNSAAKSEIGVGTVVNLQSNDAPKIWWLPFNLHALWDGPFQIAIVVLLLLRTMHFWPAMASLAVVVLIIPLTAVISMWLNNARKAMMVHTDARSKLTAEVVSGIKAIKLYAWEVPYVDRVLRLREQELESVAVTRGLSLGMSMLFTSGTVLIALAAFATYALLGYQMTPEIAFPAIALFNLLRHPVTQLPLSVLYVISARVALERTQRFMAAEELPEGDEAISTEPPPSAPGSPPAATPSIVLDTASFCWRRDSETVLRSLQLEVHAGQLVMIVGEVGSGKSSLLAALMGEMRREGGTARITGSVAYTSQDPWIQNGTLRSNIIMGRPLEPLRYQDVIRSCALAPDLQILQAGDATELGEAGMNLSGGQKHRVSLARACYADADIYLLDDPLSAVDAPVGRLMFKHAICGLLKGKTRVMVTQQRYPLRVADLVLVISDGRVVARGTLEQLQTGGVDLARYGIAATAATAGGGAVAGDGDREGEGDGSAGGTSDEEAAATAAAGSMGGDSDTGGTAQRRPAARESAATALPPLPVCTSPEAFEDAVLSQEQQKLLDNNTSRSEEEGQLVHDEERAVGRVKGAVYRIYLTSWGKYYILPMLLLAATIVERLLNTVQNWTLSDWSNATGTEVAVGDEHGHRRRLLDVLTDALPASMSPDDYFLILYAALGIGSVVAAIARTIYVVVGSLNASRNLHYELLTHLVRLPMSFFDSQPTGRLMNRFTRDTENLDVQVATSLNATLFALILAISSMAVVVTVTPLIIVPLIPAGYLYYRVQDKLACTRRELKRLEAVAMSPIFHNLGESLQGLQTIRGYRKQELFMQRNTHFVNACSRCYWPNQVVGRWVSVRLQLMGSFIVFASAMFVCVAFPENAGLAGLALTSALSLTGVMEGLVRQATDLEVWMNSVERVADYNRYAEEAPAIVEGHRPPPEWPSVGAIDVRDLVVRYRPDLAPVLKGLSFSILGCEKVGVCGRTGSGKSSLMMTLYRMVEPSAGHIYIDGIDIGSIGLFDLRSRLTLVPQDPVIFSGSIRSNLDPYHVVRDDAEIWDALQRAGIGAFVRELDGLDSDIPEGGANLSTGQRQLLCMARALLRKSKILVLDEATSRIDNASDDLIHRTIRTAFSGCTVLTIAHRLHTIVDSDRVMLLEYGDIKEFDNPQTLLRNPDSIFCRLYAENRVL